MRKLLILLTVITMVALVLNTVSRAQTEIKVGKGDLKIGGILQAGYDYSFEEDSLAVNGQFTMNRARFLFWGTIVPDKVKYFVQTETKGGVGVLDYKMIFINLLPKTSITVGRFLPNFTLYMPAPTSKLDMINYPLFLIDTRYNYAVWRQTGVQTETVTDLVDFNLGIFNGPKDNIKDDNDGKDVLLKAAFKPAVDFAKIQVGGYTWLGNFLLAEDADLAYNRFGFFGTLTHEKFTVNAELVLGSDEQSGGAKDVKSQGFYGHIGYKVLPELEILGRYEYMDPNTDTNDNGWTWITLGVNRYIESINAMIYLNYIMKLEENDWGQKDKIKND
ncbi:MAG: OprO/OprP family phosphate-selective porin, partial [candidate division KSB1 bacterium]|nr:OprO/OprP family phosphate-selective porin [candidate division KSB1 bacterium]